MATKKPTQSKSLWYILLSALAVVITALMADEAFKEILGSYVVVLYVLDKLIQAYLRIITEKPISVGQQKRNAVEEALAKEDEF